MLVCVYDEHTSDVDTQAADTMLLSDWALVKTRSFTVRLPVNILQTWSKQAPTHNNALRFCASSSSISVRTGDLVLATVPLRAPVDAEFPVMHREVYVFVWISGGGRFVLLKHPLTTPITQLEGAVDYVDVMGHPDAVRPPGWDSTTKTAKSLADTYCGVQLKFVPLVGYGEMCVQWVAMTMTPRSLSMKPRVGGPRSITGLMKQSHRHMSCDDHVSGRQRITKALCVGMQDAMQGLCGGVARCLNFLKRAIGRAAIRVVVGMLYAAARVHIVFHNHGSLTQSKGALIGLCSRLARNDVHFARASSVQVCFPLGASSRGLRGSGLPEIEEGGAAHTWESAPDHAVVTVGTSPHRPYLVTTEVLRVRADLVEEEEEDIILSHGLPPTPPPRSPAPVDQYGAKAGRAVSVAAAARKRTKSTAKTAAAKPTDVSRARAPASARTRSLPA